MENETLVIKYHPKTLDDAILSDLAKTQFNKFIENHSIPHLLFISAPGSGKTTCARLISKALNADVLFVKASLNGGVDNIRNKIREFTEALSMDDNIKIVILDEADGLTVNAQEALRNLIDSSQVDTRFILTGNSSHKIIDAIKSRCQYFDLSFDIKLLAKYVKHILDEEHVEYSNQTFTSVITTIQHKIFPDIRATINYVESCIINKSLIIKDYSSMDTLINTSEYIFNEILNNVSIFTIRKTLVKRQDEFRELWENLAGEMFNYVSDILSKTLEFEIIGKLLKLIAIFITRIGRVAVNKDIQFYAMLFEIQNILNKG